MSDILKPWKQLSSRVCCQNSWIKVREDAVLLPTGHVLDSYIVIEYCGAVAIWLINDKSEVLMVRQYRYPLSRMTVEIPAGAILGQSEEDIKQSARRELREETGYIVRDVELLTSFHPSPGSSDEVIYIVKASGIEKVEESVEPKDIFQHQWIPVETVFRGVMSGQIMHGPTIAALFHWICNQGDAGDLLTRLLTKI